jgi:diguanylate cyclase (GGDEF)-like protein/PAS domain S-box-containing protein
VVTDKFGESDLADLIREIGLDEKLLQLRLAYVGFSPDDAQRLADLQLPASAGFLDRFYGHLRQFETPAALLGDEAGMARLKRVQGAYFARLFSGQYDLDYMIDRLRVGLAHQRIGLTPGWYLGAYATYLCQLLPQLERACGADTARFVAAVQALVKLIFFDIGVALEAYFVEEKKALDNARRQAEITFDAAPMGLVVLNRQLCVVRANPAFLDLVGQEAEQVLGRPVLSVLDADLLADCLAAALAGHDTPRRLHMRAILAQRGLAGISVSCVQIPFRRSSGVLLSVEDLSALEGLQQSLKESEDTLLRAQAVAGVGSWRFDLDDKELRWTPETYRIFGLPAGQPVDYATFLACVHPQDREGVEHAWQAALAGANYHIEHRVLAGNAERWVEERAELHCDAQGRPRLAVGTVQDITERKFAAQRIEHLAFYDALTGLPNRVSFMERLQQALTTAGRGAERLALLYVDLDNFKETNDAEGHQAGDRVLVEVARRLNAIASERATVARLASDEFAVLLPESDEAGTRQLILAIQRGLAMSSRYHADALRASMGVACFPDDAGSAQDLLACAEIAMYQAKSRGAGHAFYHKQHGDSQRRRYSLARALERAIKREQLSLVYQPQVTTHDGRLAGVEALLRWHDPGRGWISPTEFIPVAETQGLIRALGQWALRRAGAQAAAWRAAGTPLSGRIAVNVSARQLDDAGFFDEALALVREAGATPADIELELTESGLMRDPHAAGQLTRALTGAGFSIAVDDFGTGYSSLAQLKRLPVGKLKIDMSLVRDMLVDKSDYAIVSAVVAMGRSLGIATVAEGVEAAEQVDALRHLGCTYIQGYHFSRPLTADDLQRQWLRGGGD